MQSQSKSKKRTKVCQVRPDHSLQLETFPILSPLLECPKMMLVSRNLNIAQPLLTAQHFPIPDMGISRWEIAPSTRINVFHNPTARILLRILILRGGRLDGELKECRVHLAYLRSKLSEQRRMSNRSNLFLSVGLSQRNLHHENCIWLAWSDTTHRLSC